MMKSLVYQDIALVNVYSTKDMKEMVVPVYLSFLKSTKSPVMIHTVMNKPMLDPTYRKACVVIAPTSIRPNTQIYQAKDFCKGGRFDRYVREFLRYQQDLWHKIHIPSEISVTPEYFSSIVI